MPSAPQDLTLPEKFSLVPLDDARRETWDQFCAASDEAWFWHTSAWHDYTLQYRPESKPRLLSFLCQSNHESLAVCPLILETVGDPAAPVAQFSFGGDAVPAPALANGLGERERSQVLRSVFQHVDRLAREHGVKQASFRGSPQAPAFWNSDFPQSNPFLRFGFHDVSLPTQVLDLSQDELLLLRSMRKGHRADIARAEKMMRALVYDHTNITEERFDTYRHLHRKAAGRVTRPLSTFRMMHDWIHRGLAILSCALLGDKPVGFALINHYKNGAYYSSGCEDPECNDLPIGHLLQWRAIQWLKLHRVSHYEVGLQFFGPQPHAPVTGKESKISFFKRGFGGRTATSWRGEKFYDTAYARRVLEERTRQFVEGMTPPPGSSA